MAVTRSEIWTLPDRGDGRLDMGTLLPVTTPVNDAVTPEQISLYAPVTGALSQSATAAVDYRQAGTSTWIPAQPLWRIQPQYSLTGGPTPVTDAFAGCIFGLTPGLTYEIRTTFNDGGPSDTRVVSFTTRALPTYSGTPAQVSDETALRLALSAASPGDIIEITANITVTSSLDMVGLNDVVLRGSSRDAVTLTRNGGQVLRLEGCTDVIVENFTITGTNADGTSFSFGVTLAEDAGTPCQNVTVRNMRIQGVDRAVHIDDGAIANGTLVYDNILTGNNILIPWGDAAVAGATWNDDGIDLQGIGNCAWNNDLSGFGDAISFNEGVALEQRACFAWRNKIINSGDDCVEFDEGGRNLGFYDNYVRNAGSGFSVDGLFGGPVYIFRNRLINWARSALKCGNLSTGALFYNNTMVGTDGTASQSSRQRGVYLPFSGNERLRAWEYRNNLCIWQSAVSGTNGDIMRIDSAVTQYTPWICTHNGWGRNNQDIRYANYAGPGQGSVAQVQAISALGSIHDNDIEIAGQTSEFGAGNEVALGATYATEITADPTLALVAGAASINAGVSLSNINNGDDIGANQLGDAFPVVGNRYAG